MPACMPAGNLKKLNCFFLNVFPPLPGKQAVVLLCRPADQIREPLVRYGVFQNLVNRGNALGGFCQRILAERFHAALNRLRFNFMP